MRGTAGITPDSPVLMGDSRLKPAHEVVVGDEVYASMKAGNRRYALALVTGRTEAFGAATRVELADGTVLLAGVDQQVLSCRGWKHTTGAEQGHARRPHLTLDGRLPSTGVTPVAVPQTTAYRRGYLAGLIRGDGHVGSYECRTRTGRKWTKHGFRLAMVDVEPLDRAELYLSEFAISTRRFVFQRATPLHRQVTALGNQTGADVARVRQLIRWPTRPSVAWSAGFLAGIFDAEGSASPCEALRICNTDPTIIEWVERSFARFGFETTREVREDRNGIAYVRLLGGVAEKLRFFLTTDPVIERKRSICGVALRARACHRVVSIDPLRKRVPLVSLSTSRHDVIASGVAWGAS
jgi:hypothetical protein